MTYRNTRTTYRLRAIGLAFVIALSAVIAGAGVAAADDNDGNAMNGATEIDSCTVIDEPGSYVLTDDIADSDADVCIDIQSSDVRFDGNGHTVDGVQTESTRNEIAQGTTPEPTNVSVGVGIGSSDHLSNVTVTDVTVTDSVFGVFMTGVTDGMIEDTTATDNVAGITVNNSSDSVVTDSTASANTVFGVLVDSLGGRVVSNNTVSDSSADRNGIGIAVFNSTDNTLSNDTATDNFIGGIFAFDHVSGTTIADSSVSNTSFAGIGVGDGTDLTIRDSTASESGYVGIGLVNTTQSSLSGNTVTDTSDTAPPFLSPETTATGYLIDNASESVIADNTVTGSAGNGMSLVNSSDTNLLLANDASENGEDGFNVNGSENLALILNTANDNGDDGIDITDSNRVVLLLNELTGNGDQAVEVNDSESVVRFNSLEDLNALLKRFVG